jgi:hypothetical protein
MQMNNNVKDPRISFRNVILGKNTKGGDRIQLYLGGEQEGGNEQVMQLIETLSQFITHPRGIVLDLHIADRQSNEGRQFKSAFAFVKAVQDKAFGGGARPTQRFVPLAPVPVAPVAPIMAQHTAPTVGIAPVQPRNVNAAIRAGWPRSA